MRIGIIHPYFDVMGGAEMTSLSLIDALLKNKTKIKLYCVKAPKISETDFLQIFQIKQKNFPLFWQYQRMMEIKKIFNAISNEDFLFIMSGGLTIQESNAKRTYLYCHSTFSKEIDFAKKEFHGIKAKYSKIIQNNINKSLKILKESRVNLISNSNFTKNEIKRNCGKDSFVIYPPVKIEKYKKFQKYDKREKIVTISRFSTEKNLDAAIEIFNQINFSCEIIGNAKYKNQLAVLERLQKKKGENVKIYSNISSEEISTLLSTAKVYLYTSKETFGISVVEAIAAGCIPIVPDNSAHCETVPFSELRYKNEKDAKEKISDAINGKFDHFLPRLQEHIQQFSEKNFQDKILGIIKNS